MHLWGLSEIFVSGAEKVKCAWRLNSSARRAGAGDFNQLREDKRLHCGVLADHLRCCFLEEGDEGQRWDPNPAQRHGTSPHLRSACIPASADGSSARFSASTDRPWRLQQTPRWPAHLPAALVAAEVRPGGVKIFSTFDDATTPALVPYLLLMRQWTSCTNHH